MNTEKQYKDRRDPTPGATYVRGKLTLLHDTGIPHTFTQGYKQRLNDCKTKLEVDRLIDLMRHTYFERNFNQ